MHALIIDMYVGHFRLNKCVGQVHSKMHWRYPKS